MPTPARFRLVLPLLLGQSPAYRWRVASPYLAPKRPSPSLPLNRSSQACTAYCTSVPSRPLSSLCSCPSNILHSSSAISGAPPPVSRSVQPFLQLQGVCFSGKACCPSAPCVLCLGPEQGIFQSSSAREGIFELDASQSSCVRIFARQTARFLGWKWKREGSRCST